MKRKFKFIGEDAKDSDGKRTGRRIAKNFGKYGMIEPGKVIETDNAAEIAALEEHHEFEEVVDKKAKAAADKAAEDKGE